MFEWDNSDLYQRSSSRDGEKRSDDGHVWGERQDFMMDWMWGIREALLFYTNVIVWNKLLDIQKSKNMWPMIMRANSK